ncbi:hypothetical protein L0222_04630 [bacterium]|nr:hypothetical protein [bacterium]
MAVCNVYRLLGILPVCFFLAHLSYHLSHGTPQHLLWLCNLSNLVLAAGLFFQLPLLIRIAVLWLIPGIPLWLWDMSRTGDNPLSTFLSHLGGLTVAIIALSKVRATQNMFLYAWMYGFLVQMICRLFTPPELNVNVAFQIYPGFKSIFQNYSSYWIFSAVFAAAALWLLSFLLNRAFPNQKQEEYGTIQTKTA